MRLIQRFASSAAWLEIALSPLLIGGIAGGMLWLAVGGQSGAISGLLLAAVGVTAGIACAEKARRHVGTVEFMARLNAHPELQAVSSLMTLPQLNSLPEPDRAEALAKCCGATAWVTALNQQFPFATPEALFAAAAATWQSLSEADWREAFTHHPKIGDINSLKEKFASTSTWAAGEQGAVQQASPATLEALAAGNGAYEQKFGYIFIVCATGKSADEMLALLQARLPNEPVTEIHIAMAEQAKITQLRLEKLLAA